MYVIDHQRNNVSVKMTHDTRRIDPQQIVPGSIWVRSTSPDHPHIVARSASDRLVLISLVDGVRWSDGITITNQPLNDKDVDELFYSIDTDDTETRPHWTKVTDANILIRL